MSNVFDSQVMNQEFKWFANQTSQYEESNSITYNLGKGELDRLKNQFFGSKSNIFRTSKLHNEAYTLEYLMRHCFKKCNKFVLEDWIEQGELECTLKCANLQKEAFKILKEKSF